MMALRTTGGTLKAPFIPSEDWIEAFISQMDEPEFHHRVYRYARRRARLVAYVRKLDVEAYATDLVQDILDDTLQGGIAWDPKRVDLRKHVYDAIKSRSRHEYRRACTRRHISIEEHGLRVVDAATAASVESLATEPERAEHVAAVDAVVELVRQRAEDDVEVLRLLDAYERGLTLRGEILEVAGLTKLQYDAARKRLDRMIDELPNQLITRARNR